MPQFAANLGMLFTEYPMAERIDRAAAAGFKAVELLYPGADDAGWIRDALARNNMTLVQFNLPAGDVPAGERGIANDPRRTDAFRSGTVAALELASELGVGQLNCLVGRSIGDIPIHDQWATLRENIAFAAEEAAKRGILQMIEPINTIDSPGYIVCSPHRGFAFLDEVGHPNLKVQYDLYHAQRMEGNLLATMRDHVGQIGHIQIADSPDRHEPGTGEICYSFLLPAIDEIGYRGWVSLEYNPATTTEEGLRWLQNLGYSL